jgi:hypothetical protein
LEGRPAFAGTHDSLIAERASPLKAFALDRFITNGNDSHQAAFAAMRFPDGMHGKSQMFLPAAAAHTHVEQS